MHIRHTHAFTYNYMYIAIMGTLCVTLLFDEIDMGVTLGLIWSYVCVSAYVRFGIGYR